MVYILYHLQQLNSRNQQFSLPRFTSIIPTFNNSATSKDILSRQFASNVIVSERSKLIYCPIPKAANSNWKYLIRKWEGFVDYTDLPRAHDRYTSGLRYLSDYSYQQVDRLLQDPTYFKFLFVRNPYSRALSCYMDKFRNNDSTYVNKEYRTFLAQLFNWQYAREVDIQNHPRPSFRSFVDQLTRHEPITMNAHWAPQTLLCGLDIMPYDFVGHMEHLQKDTQYVLSYLDKQNDHFPTHEEIGFPPSGASEDKAKLLYTNDLLLKIRAIYDMDFRYLEYDSDE